MTSRKPLFTFRGDDHRGVRAVVLAAFLGWGLHVRAQDAVVPPPPIPADYELRWSAPDECPNEDAIRVRVSELQPIRGQGTGTALVTGHVEPSHEGYALTLTTELAGRIDARTMKAARCEELAESTALVLAVALDHGFESAFASLERTTTAAVPPSTEPRESAPTSVHAAQPEPPAREPETAPPPIRTTPASRANGSIRVAALGEIGVLGPNPTGGPHLAVGVTWTRARVELYGTYLAPRLRLTDAGEGGRFQAGLVGARGCFILCIQPDIQVPFCAGLEGGATRVDTQGLAVTRTILAPWLAPTVSVGVGRIFGRVGPWAALEGAVRAMGRNYALRGELVFPQLPVSFRVLLGVEILLGRRPS